jgi:small subunit ribosomal protein S10e
LNKQNILFALFTVLLFSICAFFDLNYISAQHIMFIPKEHRIATFSYLFREGVCVVKKDNRSASHPHIEGPSNLEVLNLMKSLQSSKYVKITFSWQYNYCYLTDAGIEYLRQYLGLPAEVVPATHKQRAMRPESRDRDDDNHNKYGGGADGRRPPAFRGGDRGGDRGDREYRGRREGGGGGGAGFGRGGGI